MRAVQEKNEKKFADKLSRFRNDVREFSEKFGGVKQTKAGFKAAISRKEKRKLERKLKNAKRLAYSKKEKMPTFESICDKTKKSKKKIKPQKNKEEEETPVKEVVKKETKNSDQKMNAIELVESTILSEEKRKKNYEKSTKKNLKHKLIKDNEAEDKEIARLEKLLHIKKGTKKLKQAFYDEGLGDLLEFCDEEKRQDMLKNERNLWLDQPEAETNGKTESKKDDKKIKKSAQKEEANDEESNEDQSEVSDEENEEDFDSEEQDDLDDEEGDDEEGKEMELEDQSGSEEDDKEQEDFSDEDMSENEDEDEDELDDDEKSDKKSLSEEEEPVEKLPKGVKEDIYGRLVDKKGNVIKSEKYIPPAQRLKQLLENSSESNIKLAKLSKQINGLLNRLSTSNMHSICNQIIQMFYSNQFTRYDLIETIYSLFTNSLIKPKALTPLRLVIEHAALVCILSANIGVEVGANLLQKFCLKINEYLESSEYLSVENKTLDNLILLLCNLYNFKLFASNLIIDLSNDKLVDRIKIENETIVEKIVDLILIIFRSVGFSLRKENPLQLKDLILNLQSKINLIKNSPQSSESMNNRLKFMIESLNAIKNNDIRKLDAFDSEPIEQIKKNAKQLLKDEQTNQLNISFKDLINASELGRWWIVGSAWQLKENDTSEKTNDLDASLSETNGGKSEGFSEKILKLAKKQHMNTDIRRAIFCIIVSAEDYTDAFMKLVKLSLKKQQEREIIYVIMHCALNEKAYNPYYSYLMQKFCQYDRRFKMTLQFHSWDKFKMLTEMSQQQIRNLAFLICHLIATDCVTLSILKNIEFGEMNKYIMQFLTDLLKKIFTEQTDKRFQEIFLRISTINKLSQLRNALKLFISHFILTDKGKPVELEDKLRFKCEIAQKYLSINSSD